MFYTHANSDKGFRTIKQAAQAVAGYVTPDSGYWPIWRKVNTRTAPYNYEVAAYVRHNGDSPYVMRIDRNGYDIQSSWTDLA